MYRTSCRLLILLLVLGSSLALAAQQHAGTISTSSTPNFTPDTTPPQGTYPEIVRLSLVEGDVRIARGKEGAKVSGNTWEQAVTGIPLESGFNLATGPNGRAEIEFEDASTIYLGPNSALSLPDLTTKDGVPRTALSLLSGSLTLHVKPDITGDKYQIETPTDSIGVNFGDENYTRITSYLDGLQITPMDNTHFVFNHEHLPAPAGTTYEVVGYRLIKTHTHPSPELATFDAWVKQRVTDRDAAMKLVMQQAGLQAPLPGLADLAGKGTFIPCAPYGTCWKPNDGWVQQQSGKKSSPAGAGKASAQPADTSQSTQITPLAEAPAKAQQSVMNISTTGPQYLPAAGGFYDDLYDDAFPCSPYSYWYRRAFFLDPTDFDYPYDFAVCHAGWWLYRNNSYVWVVGTRRHHRCPVRWVKYHGKLAYVPSHPRDRKGELPVNLRHGIYRLTENPRHPVDRVIFEGKSPPKILDETPKDFRSPALRQLARADSPNLSVHFMHDKPRTNINERTGAPSANRPANSLTFDQHSNRFMLASRVTEGGRTRTFTEPMSDHGGHIASASQGGYHPGSGGSAPSHAYGGGSVGSGGNRSGAGYRSAGASHSGGGGYSGSAGGGHASGGGGGSSSSGARASAGAGGAHH